MNDNEIDVHFNKDEWKKLPLTVKTTKKVSPLTTNNTLQIDSIVISNFHSTKQYLSQTFYKPVSSLFYE